MQVLGFLHFGQYTFFLIFPWMISFAMCVHVSTGSKRFRAESASVQISFARMQGHMFLKLSSNIFMSMNNIEMFQVLNHAHSIRTFKVCFFLKIFSHTVQGNSFFVFTELSISACTFRTCNRNDFLLLETRPQYLHVALAA